MNIRNVIIVIGIGMITLASCNSQNKGVSEKIDLKTQIDSVSYGLGVSIGENMMKGGLDSLNYEAFAVALYHVLEGKTVSIPQVEAEKLLQNYFRGISMKKGEKDKTAGMKFLDDNKKNDSIVVLPSGLQYKILQAGTGPKPGLTDKVKVHYRGSLVDGKVFDSSYDRNEPAVFGVNQVIPGWTEALQLMPVGSKWMVYIPFTLAYGERGAGEVIPPYATLIFQVELLSIEK